MSGQEKVTLAGVVVALFGLLSAKGMAWLNIKTFLASIRNTSAVDGSTERRQAEAPRPIARERCTACHAACRHVASDQMSPDGQAPEAPERVRDRFVVVRTGW
jgi:hypothetical protein